MQNSIDLKKIDDYLEKKIEEGKDKVTCSYFEVKTKVGISKADENEFLRLARNKLENRGYNVFFTNAVYTYNNRKEKVGINNFLVGIKN